MHTDEQITTIYVGYCFDDCFDHFLSCYNNTITKSKCQRCFSSDIGKLIYDLYISKINPYRKFIAMTIDR